MSDARRKAAPVPRSASRGAAARPADRLDDDFYFRALMDATSDSIYFKDRDCRLQRVSRRLAQNLGFTDPADVIGKTDRELFGEAFGQQTFLDDMRIMDSDEGIVGLVESRVLEDGRLNWTLTSKLPLHDAAGKVVGLMGITREINELKQTEIDLQDLATHDSLTGLPNRYLMMDRLRRILLQAKRSDSIVGVLFLDLDGFKAVNDAYGHDFGDLVLRAVAERLVTSVRSSDTVARIGGDEFVVILDTLDKVEHAPVVAANLRRNLARQMTLERRRVKLTVSIGISLRPHNGTEAEVLLRAADYAMYLAKKGGKDAWAMCPTDLALAAMEPVTRG
jgi:diguanylate cyclase (GGDEF)-like protein/PAS domain S-box-containing protein